MDAAYLSAACPEPVQILGLSLRPFSLGHWLLLARFDNSFLAGKPAVDDLIFGVLVCSMTYEEGLAFVSASDRDEQVKAWAEKVKASCKAEGIGIDWPAKATLFSNYLIAGQQAPNYCYDDTGKNEPVGSPWPQVLKVTLMAELGLSESEVLNRPLTRCWWDYLGWREINNKGIKLIEPEMLESYAGAQVRADANHDRLVKLLKTGGKHGT